MENILVLTRCCSCNVSTRATVAVSTIIYDMRCRSSVLHTHSQLLLKPARLTYLLNYSTRSLLLWQFRRRQWTSCVAKTPICRVGRLLWAVVRHLARSDTLSCRVIQNPHVAPAGVIQTPQDASAEVGQVWAE